MHEDASQVQLHLEAHIHVGTIDGWRPPQSEPPIRDLVQTTPLCIGQLLVLPVCFQNHTLSGNSQPNPEEGEQRPRQARVAQFQLSNQHASANS
jgi:hypothetical protein